MDKKIKQKTKGVLNRLLYKEDFLHSKHAPGSLSETEANIVLVVILFVIILLFWVPLSEVIR